MEFKAWFQCINPDCGRHYELTDIIYRCRDCDELLEVKHDMDQLKKRPAKRLINQINFEEIDHRLSCGWHVELEENGQRKRYLRQVKSTPQIESENRITT